MNIRKFEHQLNIKDFILNGDKLTNIKLKQITWPNSK